MVCRSGDRFANSCFQHGSFDRYTGITGHLLILASNNCYLTVNSGTLSLYI